VSSAIEPDWVSRTEDREPGFEIRVLRSHIDSATKTKYWGRMDMTDAERFALAAAVMLIDLLLFALPLTGIIAAYVIVARPVWFREWVDRMYAGPAA
jgi:hypothetical protein